MREHEVPRQNRNKYEAAMRAGVVVAIATVAVVGCTIATHEQQHDENGSTIHTVSTETNILNGTWQYMPGARVAADGLHIGHADFAIVKQDGTDGQLNPPVNLFGTHVRTDGDFSIDATISDQIGPADIQFYGETPIIQDEFRIERKSIRLRVDGDKLGIAVWDGGSQQPTEQTVAVTTSDAPNVGIEKDGPSIDVTLNDAKVAELKDPGIFSSHDVWIGADAPAKNGQWLLSKLGAQGLHNDKLQLVDTSTIHVPNAASGETLQHMASRTRPGFLLGAAMALGPSVSDSEYARTAFQNFGSLTTENALKWQFVHPDRNTYAFQEADALVKLAECNGLQIHGHTLVFGEANPHWVTDMPTSTTQDKQAIHDTMIDHIKTVVGHFKGEIASWDVVNEPLTDVGAMRDHIWYRAMGERYIDDAFNAAHEADPHAQLYMNMYGAEAPGDTQDNLFMLAKRLKNRGVPITGIGLQSHVYERGDKYGATELRNAIKRFASLGLRVRISEIDVYSDDGQRVQADQYATTTKTCIVEPACVSVTTWGVSDRYDQWRDDDGSVRQGQDFLWNKDMKPTPAVSAIQSVLQSQ